MMNLDPNVVRQQIDNLLLQYPELAEDDVLRADMVEGSTDAHEFLRQVERRRQDAASMAGALTENIAQIELRQERFERREKAMRQLGFKILEAANLRSIELPEATYSIRKGTPKVIIIDEAQLPDIACRFKREPDKTKIKELLQADPFFVAGAELSNAEPVLSIRRT